MNLLKLKLRPASFRGVRFEVREAEHTAGRRTALHEYPMRDRPYVEDIGRAAREYSMTAYICGVDYIARTKKLIKALETAGAGKLVHPWLGDIVVTPTSVGTVSFSDKLGLATVALTFTEAGELSNPSGRRNFLQQLRESVDAVMQRAADAYADAVNLEGVQDFVRDAQDTAWSVAGSVLAQDAFLASVSLARQISAIPVSLVSADPAAFARQLVSAAGVNQLVGVFSDWRGATGSLVSTSRSASLAHDDAQAVAGSSDETIISNRNAMNDLVRTVVIANAAGAASLIGSDYDDSAATSYDELIALRDRLLDTIDELALVCVSDEVCELLEQLRTDVFQALTEQARDNARLITLEVPAGTPLVVAAYDRYQDAERADELARMNSVRHLGFSPAGGLKALSR